jgi:hypothetical protein
MFIPANDIVLITNTAIRFSLLGFMEPSLISGSKIWDERSQGLFNGYFLVFDRVFVEATGKVTRRAFGCEVVAVVRGL